MALLKERAWHCERVVLGFAEGKQRAKPEDVDALVEALEAAANACHTMGNFSEATAYQGRLCSVLQRATGSLPESTPEQLSTKLEVIQKLAQSTLLDCTHTDLSSANIEAKCLDLQLREDSLLGALERLPNILLKSVQDGGESSEDSEGGGSSDAIPRHRQHALNQQVTKVLLAFISGHGLLPASMTAEHEATMLETAGAGLSLPERAFLGAHLVVGNRNSLPPPRLATLAEAALDAFDGAGRPRHMVSIAGAPIVTPIYIGMSLGKLASGHLGDSCEARIDSDLPSLGVYSPLLLSGLEMAEMACDWLHSRRVRVVHNRQITAAERIETGKDKQQLQSTLLDAWDALHPRMPYMLEDRRLSADDVETCVAKSITAFWERLIGAAIELAEPSGFQGLRITCLARHIEYVVGRLLTVSSDDSDAGRPLSILGWELLARAERLLSSVISIWEAKLLNVYGSATHVASALLMARAMLHWCQWELHATGRRSQSPEPAAVSLGIVGVVEPVRDGAPTSIGLPAVVSCLLLAQRVSAEAGEVLTVCVPATLWLTRILAGYHRRMRSAVPGDDSAARCFVPERLPGCDPERAESIVAVRNLRFGSADAITVALHHLDDVAAMITVRGCSLDLQAVRSEDDVALSESVWEMAGLRRWLVEQLAADD